MIHSFRSPYDVRQPFSVKVGAWWGEVFGRPTHDNLRNSRRGIKIISGMGLATAVFVSACDTQTPKPTAHCEFSTETTQVSVPDGEGIDSAILQIDGVTHGTCMESARDILALLNPDVKYLQAPKPGQEFIVPVSAQFVEG